MNKEIRESLIIILIIFGIELFILILLHPYINPKPEYNIIKEVCVNETNEFSPLAINSCSLGCLKFKIIINSSIEYYNLCKSFCLNELNLTIQKCSRVEVDKIEKCVPFNESSCVFQGCIVEIDGEEVAEIKDGKYCIKISKSDLTQDWLDGNCECIDYCRKVWRQVECPANEEVIIERNYKCSKYKCGEFWVEVK